MCIPNQSANAGEKATAPDEITNLFSDQSENGYIQIGSVQIAWGKENSAALKDRKTAHSVAFPAPFFENPAVTLSPQQTGAIRFSPYIVSVTRTSFTFKAVSPNSEIFSWIAIGKWRK
jgi:hypothetical protein